jgi:hypothetical protein
VSRAHNAIPRKCIRANAQPVDVLQVGRLPNPPLP